VCAQFSSRLQITAKRLIGGIISTLHIAYVYDIYALQVGYTLQVGHRIDLEFPSACRKRRLEVGSRQDGHPVVKLAPKPKMVVVFNHFGEPCNPYKHEKIEHGKIDVKAVMTYNRRSDPVYSECWNSKIIIL